MKQAGRQGYSNHTEAGFAPDLDAIAWGLRIINDGLGGISIKQSPAARLGPERDAMSAALDLIPALPRRLLERFVQRAIEHLNGLDGDTDLELSGDDEPSEDEELE